MAGEVSGGHRPAYVQGLLTTQGGELFGDLADRGVEVEGVGEVELGIEMDGAVVGDLVGVDVEVPGLRGIAAALVGGVGVEPGPGLFHGPLQLGEGDLPAIGATWRSTNPAPSIGRDMVAWAIVRAFHTGTSPASTRAQSRGSR